MGTSRRAVLRGTLLGAAAMATTSACGIAPAASAPAPSASVTEPAVKPVVDGDLVPPERFAVLTGIPPHLRQDEVLAEIARMYGAEARHPRAAT